MANHPCKIIDYSVRDIRFPTSKGDIGSDALHTDPDYSAAYVTLITDSTSCHRGYGITFTLGRGTEIVVCAVHSLMKMVVGRTISDIFSDMGSFYRSLTNDSQLRWLGPETGVVQLAVAAILNATWDLMARMAGKPLWKLLVDMEPNELVACIDFRYMSDALTKDEALEILNKNKSTKSEREKELCENGFPAYGTHAGWLNYSDEKVTHLVKEAMSQGWSRFKLKVGAGLERDIERCRLVRQLIGDDALLMVDANQRWDVSESVEYMKHLAQFKPLWIEEPTSPHDVLGHLAISKALKPYGIAVATGEHCQNRVLFKQFLQSGAMQYCQIDSCRVGSVNENIAIILMAAKFNVPVCPHAGGVGLCGLVQHLSYWDYVCVSATKENRMIEYVDHLHEHFVDPPLIRNCAYVPQMVPGYSTEMKPESLDEHEYPGGAVWK